MKHSQQILQYILLALIFPLNDTLFMRGMDIPCNIQKKDPDIKVTCYFPKDINTIEEPFVMNFFKDGREKLYPSPVLECYWEQRRHRCEMPSNLYKFDSNAVLNGSSVSVWILNASTTNIGIYMCNVYGAINNKDCLLTEELIFDSQMTTKQDSVPDVQESTTTNLKEDLKTGAVKYFGPSTDTGYTLIVTVATCVCLVVITTVITAGLVCCVKARRRYEQTTINPDMNVAFVHLNEALHVLNISKDQARDIYEEIPDLPKTYRTSRVGSTASSKSGVKLPPIPLKQQNEATATQCQTEQAEVSHDFGGYLHPMCVSTAQLDNKEYTDKSVQSP